MEEDSVGMMTLTLVGCKSHGRQEQGKAQQGLPGPASRRRHAALHQGSPAWRVAGRWDASMCAQEKVVHVLRLRGVW